VGTLREGGERALADRIVEKLLATQREDGSWASPFRSAARETSDALRGLLAAGRPPTEPALRRAARWCLERGRARPASWPGRDPDAPLALAAALDAFGRALGDANVCEAARRIERDEGSAWHAAVRAATRWRGTAHSHHDRLVLLLDLGRADRVERRLTEAERVQRADGAVPDAARSRGSCARCVAQLASAWYRTGKRAPADRALVYLTSIQDESGALPEDAEPGTRPRPSPAATRELIEAVHTRIAAAFATQVDDFEDHIRPGDGRLGFLLREAGPLAGRRVLDAGCGRGAVARAVLTACPSAALTAMDLSPQMLAHAPAQANRQRGSIQNLPFEDGAFDVAYCVEALEHAGNPEGAVDELCRVVRPGGRVLVVDKNAERAGALPIEAWESWFDRREVEGWLGRHCTEVRSTLLVHCPELGPDLFVGWRGTRRAE
jgi:hypothetical protein